MPGVPTDLKATVTLQANDTGINGGVMYLRWNEPHNADLFDVQYYSVQVTIPQQSSPLYAANVTSTELLMRMELSVIPKDMNLSVAAVSRCSETQGQQVVIQYKHYGETAADVATEYSHALSFATTVHTGITKNLLLQNISLVRLQMNNGKGESSV